MLVLRRYPRDALPSALDARIKPRIKSADVHDEAENRSAYIWASPKPRPVPVARVAEFDGAGGYSLPLVGEGWGGGIAGHSQIKGPFFKWIQRRDPPP